MLSIVIRRAALVASKKAPLVGSVFFKSLSTQPTHNRENPHIVQDGEEVPVEAYDAEGHLLTGHLEYLERMLEKTTKMEESMDELKGTYNKKREVMAASPHYSSIKWMEFDEIENLFNTAGQQKEEISTSIAELKAMMTEAKKTYAVDAPDGETDWHMKEEMIEVDHIIADAANFKERDHFDKRIYAVDAPDGEDDGHFQEELAEINQIIDDAAKVEVGALKEKITQQHKTKHAVRDARARDPEHDW